MEILKAVLLALALGIPSIAFYMAIDSGIKRRAKQREQMQRTLGNLADSLSWLGKSPTTPNNTPHPTHSETAQERK